MDLCLQGKKVLIFGGSKGIGLASAKMFLEEGAYVCLVARDEAKLKTVTQQLAKDFGHERILWYTADCTIEDKVKASFEYVLSNWKTIHTVVSCIGDGHSSSDAISEEAQWQSIWKVNFDSIRFICRAALKWICPDKGSIVFVSSIAGLESIGAPTDYSTAKSAISTFVKNVARKTQPGLRINVIAPGNVLVKGGRWEQRLKESENEVTSLINRTVPMKRFGRPEEIANFILFAASECSSFMTGSTIVVDGGQTTGI
ncbi:SDR family oxidoreductase [Aestuariibacter sp. AA17]|uniref:SDR family oxidoreductase n=1 Tax=Fluctibacter corallii TaxID=2984329 RepID=A0ABT3AA25_9ALTE|nr:SDR family oxidoreductase [Aestuariibacter sp. AA17]MCV2885437.1 SDR family oxidoreductase [Aestuariibacter sp. AA17]